MCQCQFNSNKYITLMEDVNIRESFGGASGGRWELVLSVHFFVDLESL